jgi:hypothetical protein
MTHIIDVLMECFGNSEKISGRVYIPKLPIYNQKDSFVDFDDIFGANAYSNKLAGVKIAARIGNDDLTTLCAEIDTGFQDVVAFINFLKKEIPGHKVYVFESSPNKYHVLTSAKMPSLEAYQKLERAPTGVDLGWVRTCFNENKWFLRTDTTFVFEKTL